MDCLSDIFHKEWVADGEERWPAWTSMGGQPIFIKPKDAIDKRVYVNCGSHFLRILAIAQGIVWTLLLAVGSTVLRIGSLCTGHPFWSTLTEEERAQGNRRDWKVRSGVFASKILHVVAMPLTSVGLVFCFSLSTCLS